MVYGVCTDGRVGRDSGGKRTAKFPPRPIPSRLSVIVAVPSRQLSLYLTLAWLKCFSPS